MTIFLERVLGLLESKGLSKNKLLLDLGLGKNSFVNWTNRNTFPNGDTLRRIADYFNVSVDYLINEDATPAGTQQELTSNIAAVYDDHIRMIPVYESVSAGFGALADNTVTDFQPVRIVSDSEAAETICIRVTGDSMFPKIEDGDIIQVRKQDSVDSGDIAVVLLDGEEGLVKRVVYGETWIELHSINPMYQVQRFEGAEVQRLRVVGLVRGVFHAF